MGFGGLTSISSVFPFLLSVEPATGPILRVLFGAWDPIPQHRAEPGRPGAPEGVLRVWGHLRGTNLGLFPIGV